MKVKKRLDVLLTEQGYADTRSKAQAIIMSGQVYVNGQKADKPGVSYEETVELEVRGAVCPYVSRGGLKLDKAMKTFPITLDGYVCMDIGASHGGFTDCMLQNGAAKVYAVDVGYGQLDYKLRTDERVINMEKTNARYLEADSLGEMVDVVTTDVSFISLDKILPPAMTFLKEGGHVLALIKPQFEAGKENVGKKGVVRDPAVHRDVVEKILALCDEINLTVWGLDFSPVKGPEGNIEYLLWGCKNPDTDFVPDAAAVVAAAHDRLD